MLSWDVPKMLECAPVDSDLAYENPQTLWALVHPELLTCVGTSGFRPNGLSNKCPLFDTTNAPLSGEENRERQQDPRVRWAWV